MSAARGNPEDETLIAEAVASALLNVRIAGIGIVQSYDDATKTCSVQPAVRRPLETEDGDVRQETSDIVQNVMVGHWGSSVLAANTVLVKGDAVILVYLEYSPALWRKRGQVSDTPDTHKSGPSYPVAFPFHRPGGAPGTVMGNAIGKPGGLQIFFGSVINVGTADGAGDFVALKPALDAFQTAHDAHTHGTPWGPTTPPVASVGPLTSSDKLKA